MILVENRGCRTLRVVAAANLEEREMEYLYAEDGELVFMDPASYEQLTLSEQLVGDATDLLRRNLLCRVTFINERAVDVTLPTYVELDVTATVDSPEGTKKATVETGAVIDVPMAVRVGDTIKIDTRTRDYVERVDSIARVGN